MKRQIIVDTVLEQMKRISAANGFYSEAGKNVYEWLQTPPDTNEYPRIIIKDISSTASDTKVLEHSLKIEVSIALSNGELTPWDMREVSSDALKAFAQVEKTLNYRCAYLGSEFLLKEEDTVYGDAKLTFIVAYQTPRWEQ